MVITPDRGARVAIDRRRVGQCIFDIRRLIEPYMVRWFTEYATAEDRRILEEIQIKVQAATDAEDLPEFHKHNRGFHDLILSRHFNAEAVRIMRTQNAWLRLLTSEYPPTSLQMRRSSAEHWELIAAIKAFDADRAAEVIVKHGERSQASLMGRMQRRRSEG